MCVCVCVCVTKPVAVELRCHATALILISALQHIVLSTTYKLCVLVKTALSCTITLFLHRDRKVVFTGSQCWYLSHEPSSLIHHSVFVDLSASMMMH